MSCVESPADRELRDRDDAARREASRVFDRPVLIEAGAGTGKTTILVSRILAWCLGPGWDAALEQLFPGDHEDETVAGQVVDRVVAITFTEAAAAEMAERVGRVLVEVEQGSTPPGLVLPEGVDDPTLCRRARALLGQIHRLRTSTIHSFCTWILKRFPVEAGVDPSFTVDGDGVQVERTVHEVVEDDLRRATESQVWPQWLELAARGVTPLEVVELLAQLVGKGLEAADLCEDPFAARLVRQLADRFRGVVEGLSDSLGGRLEGLKRAKNPRQAARDLDQLQRELAVLEGCAADGVEDLEVLLSLSRPRLEAHATVLAKWARGEFGKEESEALAGVGETVAERAAEFATCWGALQQLAPAETRAGVELARDLLAETRRRLAARGVLSFDDLLERARRLLAHSAELRCELRRGISQLLVDEFQDTDRCQCEIVRLLVFGDADHGGPRPGLFVVGDPKQSIYGWRNADLAAYLDFVTFLRAHGAVEHTLSVNFRSVPVVLAEVARVVAPVMVDKPGIQPPFQRLLPRLDKLDEDGFCMGGRGAVEYWVSWPADDQDEALDDRPKVDDATLLEAAAVADDIAALHRDHAVPFAEVGVLLRTTSKLHAVLGEMRRAGVPFEVAREREYFRQREVVEAAALLRCVLDPGDQLALLTVLRSEVVGVPDAALLPLWRAGLPACILRVVEPESPAVAEAVAAIGDAAAELPADAPAVDRLPHWNLALIAAVELLATLRATVHREPAPVFVERLRSLWLAEPTAAARYLGRHRLARLGRFFDDVERALSSPTGCLDALLRLLRRAVAGEHDGVQSSAPERSRDAVQVMTIHGAKGLDFGHVYLLQMGASVRGRGASPHRVLKTASGCELRLFGWSTPGLAEAEERERERTAAELVRLLYVAMTRAKDRLVLVADWHQGRTERARPQRLAELLRQRWEPQVVGELASARRWRGPRADDPRVHWVLPQCCELPAGDAAEGEEVVVAPSLHELGPRWALLAERRAAAEDRMARPFTGGASRSAHEEWRESPLEDSRARGAERVSPMVATAVGTAIHSVLENLVLQSHAGNGFAEGAAKARTALLDRLPESAHEAAAQAYDELLAAMERGTLVRRLQSVGEAGVLARELPVLLPPDPQHGPVGAVVGYVDLVYRDPDDGRLVVADYKTDRVRDSAWLAQRVELYRPQLALYARAVAEGLGKRETPRTELWFLHADRIVEL